jgi:hypothetical protein
VSREKGEIEFSFCSPKKRNKKDEKQGESELKRIYYDSTRELYAMMLLPPFYYFSLLFSSLLRFNNIIELCLGSLIFFSIHSIHFSPYNIFIFYGLSAILITLLYIIFLIQSFPSLLNGCLASVA